MDVTYVTFRRSHLESVRPADTGICVEICAICGFARKSLARIGASILPQPWHPHLDSIIMAHYDAIVRTTVTLDDDVVRGLRALARRREQSFKQVLNDSLRLSFSLLRAPRRRVAPFRVRPHRSAFRPGIDVEKLNQLADQLEAEHRLRKVTART